MTNTDKHQYKDRSEDISEVTTLISVNLRILVHIIIYINNHDITEINVVISF